MHSLRLPRTAVYLLTMPPVIAALVDKLTNAVAKAADSVAAAPVAAAPEVPDFSQLELSAAKAMLPGALIEHTTSGGEVQIAFAGFTRAVVKKEDHWTLHVRDNVADSKTVSVPLDKVQRLSLGVLTLDGLRNSSMAVPLLGGLPRVAKRCAQYWRLKWPSDQGAGVRTRRS